MDQVRTVEETRRGRPRKISQRVINIRKLWREASARYYKRHRDKILKKARDKGRHVYTIVPEPLIILDPEG